MPVLYFHSSAAEITNQYLASTGLVFAAALSVVGTAMCLLVAVCIDR